MCGIFGIVDKRGHPVKKEFLLSIAPLLRHRGPDATGIFTDAHIGLLHTRLKIVDLSDAANQPFSDGNNILLFNGEIFNHKELRHELSSQFKFTTTSDTEVLFAALCIWGTAALDKIDGQFAFAFYDLRKKMLLLARDHVGICPLYLLETEDFFAFCSEMKPLLAAFGPQTLDAQGVMDYFSYRYTIQNGRTLLTGIRKYPAAHYSLFDVNCLRTASPPKRYWRFAFSSEADNSPEDFRLALDQEITRQLAADVPVGIFLSGGIDSGAILHGVSQAGWAPKAFTLDMGGNADIAAVHALQQKYSFHLHEMAYPEGASQKLPDVLYQLEEPFGDLIVCANALLAELASQEAKVVLSGEGGDEAFFGYDHQRAFAKFLRFDAVPGWRQLAQWGIQKAPSGLLESLSGYAGHYGPLEKTHIAHVLQALSDPCQAYINLVQVFPPQELRRLFTPAFLAHAPAEADTSPLRDIFTEEPNPVYASMRAEIEQLTLPLNLMKQDKLCMCRSLEARVPLVSRAILERAGRLSARDLCSGPVKKNLQAYANTVRRTKKAFSVQGLSNYQKQVSQLWQKYVTRESLAEYNILNVPYILEYGKILENKSLLYIKRAMVILAFVIWLDRFKNDIKY